MLESYLLQLQRAANDAGVDLKEAVLVARGHSSLYYRWINGTTEPTFQAAAEVFVAIMAMRRPGRGGDRHGLPADKPGGLPYG